MKEPNNYLGLAHHPKILEAAERALKTYGSGCTGSRPLNGTFDLHTRLEAELATFVGKEDSIVFPTGYSANLGLISGLTTRGEVIYLDKARPRVDRRRRALAIDDAHAIGVVGPNGAGTSAHFDLTDEVDIIIGTFSKSLASIGGFVADSEEVVHYLRHHSRPFLFSASLPPASTAGVLAALDIVRSEPERRRQLWANTERFRGGSRVARLRHRQDPHADRADPRR